MIAPPSFDRPLSRPDRFKFPQNMLDLLRTARPGTVRLAAASVAIAWLPTFVLAMMYGFAPLKSFLFDFAAQSRLLLIIPLLILTEPLLVARLEAVARHFVETELVKEEDLSQFESDFGAFKHRANSVVARVAIVLLIYLVVAYAFAYLRQGSLADWCYAQGTNGSLSLAGSWYVFVSLPLGLYLFLQWVWRQLLWSWFLRSVARLDLRLIPAHPDLVGGLGFVESCLRGYLPFGFAVGTIVAGGVANRVVHLHHPMLGFKYAPLAVLAIVMVLCVAPLSTFFGLLLRTRRRGIFEYGSLAIGLGHQFEEKWLGHNRKVDGAILDKPDFSATVDLYSVVANVQQMKFIPVGMQNLSQLAAATLVPAIPIALMAVPFDVLIEGTLKFLL